MGGALAATCSVTYMVMSIMASYVYKSNGLYTRMPGWSTLLTASLLHAFGRIDYCDQKDPFKKSAIGLSMNYFCTLHQSIVSVIFRNNISISDSDLANLLNVLSVAVSGRTDTKAVTKDGSILRNVINLYGECDAIDYMMANHTAEEGEEYFFAKKLRRYLLTSEVE